MKTNRLTDFVAMAALLVGILTVWGPVSPGQAPAPQQQQAAWEYKFVEYGPFPADFEKPFHDMGKKGWEYCETRAVMREDEKKAIRTATVIIFKRQVRPAPADPK